MRCVCLDCECDDAINLHAVADAVQTVFVARSIRSDPNRQKHMCMKRRKAVSVVCVLPFANHSFRVVILRTERKKGQVQKGEGGVCISK